VNEKNHKVRRAILVLLVTLTIVIVVATYYHNIDYQRYYEEKIQEAIDKGIHPDFATPDPWHVWGKGPLIVPSGLFIISVWGTIAVLKVREKWFKKPKDLLKLALFLIPLTVTAQVYGEGIQHQHRTIPVQAASPSETDVNVLFAGDEEFMAGQIYVQGYYLKTVVEEGIPLYFIPGVFPVVRDRFKDQLGINLIFHGWAEWDSDDTVLDAIAMLDEAIDDLDFYRGMIWNGVVIDMLVCYTYQDMDMRGLSPFTWNALIIEYWDWNTDPCTLQHEMSHLFGTLHCEEAWCVMNPTYVTAYWQPGCVAEMLRNKDYFTRHFLEIEHSPGGGTDLGTGEHCFYHETEVTVYAIIEARYRFAYWMLDGERVDTSLPVITITMNSSCTLKPVFHCTHSESSSSSGTSGYSGSSGGSSG